MKAAPAAEVPKQEKNKTSRINPKTREPKVKALTNETLRRLVSMALQELAFLVALLPESEAGFFLSAPSDLLSDLLSDFFSFLRPACL